MTWALIRIFRLLTHPPVRRPPRPSPGLDLDLAGPPMVLVNEPGEHVAHATSWQCTGPEVEAVVDGGGGYGVD